MSQLRPSYRYGQQAQTQPLVHPAGKTWLPLLGAAMTGASLLILLLADRLPQDPPALVTLFLCAALLLFAAVAFGVWLMSIVLLQHALWLEQWRKRSTPSGS